MHQKNALTFTSQMRQQNRCPISTLTVYYSENAALFKCKPGLLRSTLSPWPWQVYCLEASSRPRARAPAPAAPPTSTSSFLASIARRQPRTLRCHAYWILWHSRTILCGAYKKILVWDPPKTPEKVISKFNRHCRNVLLKDGSCILLPRLTFLPPEDEQKKRGLFKRHLSNV